MRAVWFALGTSCFLGMFGACSKDAAKGPGAGSNLGTVTSGSRIKASKWQADGEVGVTEFKDTELDLPCYFQLASDGEYRCLPLNEPGKAYPSVAFSNSDCKERIGYTTEDCSPGKYVVQNPGYQGCEENPGSDVFELGDEADALDEYYYLDADDNCLPVTPTEGTKFYDVKKVSLDDFVAAEKEIVEVTDELGVTVLRATDGTVIPQELYDLERETTCYPQTLENSADAPNYCFGNLGYGDGSAYGFSDAECSEAVGATASCDEPSAIMNFEMVDGCYTTELYEVGDKKSKSSIYVDQGGCMKVDMPFYEQYFALGDELSPDVFPKAERNHEGTSRLVAEMWASGGKTLTATGVIWDTELDSACYPQGAEDGKTYCVPNNVAASWDGATDFADDACTVPVATQGVNDCGGEVPELVYGQVIHPGEGACSAYDAPTFYELKKLSGDVYYYDDGQGNCTETPMQEGSVYYRFDKEFDPADVFAKLTLETDK